MCGLFWTDLRWDNPWQPEYIKMPHPLLIFCQSDYLVQIVDTKSYLMTNSADPDHLTSDLDIHCLQKQGICESSRTRVNINADKSYTTVKHTTIKVIKVPHPKSHNVNICIVLPVSEVSACNLSRWAPASATTPLRVLMLQPWCPADMSIPEKCKIHQGHQNLISSLLCPNYISMKIW